jgi:hypothetical protein
LSALNIPKDVARALSSSWRIQTTMPAAAATPNSNQWFYVKFESLMTLA